MGDSFESTEEELEFVPGEEIYINDQGNFVVGSVLGEGGYGVVLRVLRKGDHAAGKAFAIKVVHPKYRSDTARMCQFGNECSRLATLDHPNVCEVHGLFHTRATEARPSVPVIMMTYLKGHSLRDCLSAEMKPVFKFQVAAQLLEGLAAIHLKGIVHRDIKPENVMLARLGNGEIQVKLIDFGIAYVLGDPYPRGRIEGTPSHMAPAQWAGEAPTISDDIYSAGVVLRELFSGSVLFPDSDNRDKDAMKHAHRFVAPRPLAQIAPSVPADVAAIVDLALSKDPSKRPAKAEEFAIPIARELRRLRKSGSTETLADMYEPPRRPSDGGEGPGTPPAVHVPGRPGATTVVSPADEGPRGTLSLTAAASQPLADGAMPQNAGNTPAPHAQSAPPGTSFGKATLRMEPVFESPVEPPAPARVTPLPAMKPTVVYDRGSVPVSADRAAAAGVSASLPPRDSAAPYREVLTTTGPSTNSPGDVEVDRDEGSPPYAAGGSRRGVGVAVAAFALTVGFVATGATWFLRARGGPSSAAAPVSSSAVAETLPSANIPTPPPAQPHSLVAPSVDAPSPTSAEVSKSGAERSQPTRDPLPAPASTSMPVKKTAAPPPAKRAPGPGALKDSDIFSVPKAPKPSSQPAGQVRPDYKP